MSQGMSLCRRGITCKYGSSQETEDVSKFEDDFTGSLQRDQLLSGHAADADHFFG